MNKSELIDQVSEKSDVSKKVAADVLNNLIDTITDAVASGDKVVLVGFGTFEPRARKQREGRNPRTNQVVQIPATVVPAFSAGKSFKQAVAPSS